MGWECGAAGPRELCLTGERTEIKDPGPCSLFTQGVVGPVLTLREQKLGEDPWVTVVLWVGLGGRLTVLYPGPVLLTYSQRFWLPALKPPGK